jgi:hypothetical protein
MTPSESPNLAVVVTVKDLAAFLRVDEATIYYWKAQRRITPLVDTGRVLRFDLREVIKDLKPAENKVACTRQTNPLEFLGSNRSLKTSDGGLARKETGNG